MAITKASGQAVAPAAKGDLVVGSATNDAAVLGVGSADQVLTVDSSTTTGLKWATPSSGGMTLISTTSLSGASTVISSIPATYIHLQLIIRDILPATDGQALQMRLNGDSNARYRSSALGTAATGTPDDTSFLNLTGGMDNSVTQNLQICDFYDYTNTVTWKYAEWQSISINSDITTQVNLRAQALVYNQTAAISSITLFMESGNITSGTALLYGVK